MAYLTRSTKNVGKQANFFSKFFMLFQKVRNPYTMAKCAFMDDLSLMYSTVSGAQTLLSRCTTALTWAGLEFRDDKSRSIIIIKGSSMNTTPFSVPKAKDQPEPSSSIPSIHSRPVKFLGRIIDGSLSDRNSSAELAHKL